MDQTVALFVLVLAFALAIVLILAQIKLFSIDSTLKRILQVMEHGDSPAIAEAETADQRPDIQKMQDQMWD